MSQMPAAAPQSLPALHLPHGRGSYCRSSSGPPVDVEQRESLHAVFAPKKTALPSGIRDAVTGTSLSTSSTGPNPCKRRKKAASGIPEAARPAEVLLVIALSLHWFAGYRLGCLRGLRGCGWRYFLRSGLCLLRRCQNRMQRCAFHAWHKLHQSCIANV